MIFKKYLKLREVSEKSIKNVDLDRDLHFDNMFGNKLRILIPLNQDSNLIDLIEELKGFGYEVDYEDLLNKKVVYEKIKTEKGEKLREKRVGKILQDINQKELLNWWQQNSDKLKNSKDGVSIVVSRSPIDIVRMSDHDGIESCHSPDRDFFKCAKQEARTGGAVAYVVKNSDIEQVNLQDREIFQDYDRGIDGISPLERLRLRRFTNGNIDLLIPDTMTYASRKTQRAKTLGFASTVKNWAFSAQKEIISKIDPLEDYKKMKIKGGSYFDSGHESDFLWNNFFGVSVSGRKRSEDEEEENEENEEEIYERAERMLEDHQSTWKHLGVVLDESEGYLFYSGFGRFSLPKKDFNFSKVKNFKSWFKKIKEIAEDSLDIDGFDDLDVNENNDYYDFVFYFNPEDYYYDQLTNFERFLDYVDDVDKNFEEKVNVVYKNLVESGYIKNITENIEFKNFYIDSEDENFSIELKEDQKLYYFKDFFVENKDSVLPFSDSFKASEWSKEFLSLINKYKVLPFILENENIYFKLNLSKIREEKKDANVISLNGWVYFYFTIYLNSNHSKNKEIIKRLKNLDNNFDFYIQKLYKLFDFFVKTKQIKDFNYSIDSKEFSKKPGLAKRPKQLRFNFNFKEWFQLNEIKSFKLLKRYENYSYLGKISWWNVYAPPSNEKDKNNFDLISKLQTVLNESAYKLGSLGFKAMKSNLILSDLSHKKNRHTDGGVAGQAHFQEHGIVIDIKKIKEYVVIHEHAHMIWKNLPKVNKDFFISYFDSKIKEFSKNIDLSTKEKIFGKSLNIPSDLQEEMWLIFKRILEKKIAEKYEDKYNEQTSLERIFYLKQESDEEKFILKSILLPMRVLNDFFKIKKEIYVYTRSSYSKLLKKGESVGVFTSIDNKYEIEYENDKKETYFHAYDSGFFNLDELLDYVEFDIDDLNSEKKEYLKERLEIANKIKKSSFVEIFGFTKNKGLIDEMFNETFEEITERIRNSQSYQLAKLKISVNDIFENFYRRGSWIAFISKRSKNEKIKSIEDIKDIFYEITKNVIKKEPKIVSEFDPDLDEIKDKLTIPEGDELRSLLSKSGASVSSYGASNVDELWATTVEYAALGKNVSNELKKLLWKTINGF
jgi:hypothetical protein